MRKQQTVAQCVSQVRQFLEESGVCGEVLVADNGSADNSAALAQEAGARVVNIDERGYGNALIGGNKRNERYPKIGVSLVLFNRYQFCFCMGNARSC